MDQSVHYQGDEKSSLCFLCVKGWQGVLKKLGYWLMVLVSFGAGAAFIAIGDSIVADLGVTTLLGWFVLACLIINEMRSILENFVEAGFKVPAI